MFKSSIAFYFLLIFFLNVSSAFAQIAISGPSCVVSGANYTYNITGNWDSLSTMALCLTGGIIADSTGAAVCTPLGPPLNAVTVIWNDTTSGSLTLTSSSGNATFNVDIIMPLSAGSVETSVKTQMISIDSIPSSIICSEATGGACSPSYFYQWQWSSDIVNWVDITQVTSKDLVIKGPLAKTTYYRRRVTENISGSIAYSDVASVFFGLTGYLKASERTNFKKIDAEVIFGVE